MTPDSWDALLAALARRPRDRTAARSLVDAGLRLGRLEAAFRAVREGLAAPDAADAEAFFRLAWAAGFGLGDPHLQVPGSLLDTRLSPDGAWLAAGTDRAGAFVFSARDGRLLVRAAAGHAVDRVELLADRGTVLALGRDPASPDPVLRLWALHPAAGRARNLGAQRLPGRGPPVVRALSPSGRRLLVETLGEPPGLWVVELREGAPAPADLAGARILPVPSPAPPYRVAGGELPDTSPWVLLRTHEPGARTARPLTWMIAHPETGQLADPGMSTAREVEWTWSPDGRFLAGRGLELVPGEPPRPGAGRGDARAQRFAFVLALGGGPVAFSREAAVVDRPLELGPDGGLVGATFPPGPESAPIPVPPEGTGPPPRLARLRGQDGWVVPAPDDGDPAAPLPGGHLDTIERMVLFAGGTRLATQAPESETLVWDLGTGLPLLFRLPADRRLAAGARDAPRVLMTTFYDAEIFEGDELDRRERRRPRWAASGFLTDGDLAPDGQSLLVGTDSGRAVAYRSGPRTAARPLAGFHGGLARVGFLAGGTLAFGLSRSGELRVFSLADGADHGEWQLPTGTVPRYGRVPAFAHPTRDAVAVLVGGEPHLFVVGTVGSRRLLPDADPTLAFALDPQGTRLARVPAQGGLEVYALGPALTPPRLLVRREQDVGPVHELLFLPGGERLLYTQGRHVRVLDLA